MILYDEYAGQMFKGPNEEEIIKLRNSLNEKMFKQKYLSVKEYLEEIRNKMREHMTPKQLLLWEEIWQTSKDFGWCSFKRLDDEELVQFELSSGITNNGEIYMILCTPSTLPL